MPGFNIGFVIFPDLTQLDFTGPLQVLHRLPDSAVHIVAKSRAPVPSDCGLSLMPTATFEDCPRLDLICVPGGAGVVQAMNDPETVEFVPLQDVPIFSLPLTVSTEAALLRLKVPTAGAVYTLAAKPTLRFPATRFVPALWFSVPVPE